MASCKVTPAACSALVESFAAPAPEAAGLPAGFPSLVKSPLAWTSATFQSEDEYIHALQPEDIAEIESALALFKGSSATATCFPRRVPGLSAASGQKLTGPCVGLGLDGDLVTKGNFPLPTLGPKLDLIRRDIHQGKGFALIRGLDPRKYSVEDLTMIHLGIQVYIANRQGRQDRKGNMLGR